VSEPVGRLPDWIVVGAMKSGTTSVARWLKAHPEAWLVPDKEVHYFNRDELYERGPDWYCGLFAGAPADVRVGEASPTYMFVPEAVRRMAALVPDARLVACLREPVDRAYSHYWHNWHRELETRTFAEAVAAEMRDPVWAPPGYLMRGRYLPQIERLLEHYPREHLHVVTTTELAADPQAAFSAVCRHVGVDDTVTVPNDGAPENTYREHRAQRLYRAMFRYRLWRFLPDRAVPRIAELFTRPATYPPLDPSLRASLEDWFADDAVALARWLGREQVW
jgi:hypothetical protein